MKFKIYKMDFSTPVHFGNGALDDVKNLFLADTLFSALCIESLKNKGEEQLNKLVSLSKENKLLFSDAMPYIEDVLYLPKPFIKIETEQNGDSVLKKQYKKLKFLPVNDLENYLKGSLDVKKANQDFKLGEEKINTKVVISRDKSDNKPYSVGTFEFYKKDENNKKSGLYFLVGYENSDDLFFVDDLLNSLGYTGIGGKISSGYGKFIAIPNEADEKLLSLLNLENKNKFISLSTCLPKDEELEGSLKGASYTLQKRSGFVASFDYSENFLKKKDLYTFSAGSSFDKIFSGDVFDVSNEGNHPVYRYAKPLFIGVNI